MQISSVKNRDRANKYSRYNGGAGFEERNWKFEIMSGLHQFYFVWYLKWHSNLNLLWLYRFASNLQSFLFVFPTHISTFCLQFLLSCCILSLILFSSCRISDRSRSCLFPRFFLLLLPQGWATCRNSRDRAQKTDYEARGLWKSRKPRLARFLVLCSNAALFLCSRVAQNCTRG